MLEAYNVVKNSSSEEIKMKWATKNVSNYYLRSEKKSEQKVPIKPLKSCEGFTYHAPKLFNLLPQSLRDTKSQNNFKTLAKAWIRSNIPSY